MSAMAQRYYKSSFDTPNGNILHGHSKWGCGIRKESPDFSTLLAAHPGLRI